MVESYPTTGERVKLTSDLLMAFKRHMRFYEENRPDYEIRKMRSEIKYHERMLKEAKEIYDSERN